MNGIRLRKALTSLDMTPGALAHLLQLGERTVQRYAESGVTNTPTMILVNLLLLGKITQNDIWVARKWTGRVNSRAPVHGSYGPAD